jgi:hypothetical protein
VKESSCDAIKNIFSEIVAGLRKFTKNIWIADVPGK